MACRFGRAGVGGRALGLGLAFVLTAAGPVGAQGGSLAPGDIVVVDGFAFGTPGTLDPSGGVIRVDPATGAQAAIASGGFIFNPVGMALEADGHILIGNPGLDASNVLRIDPATGTQTIAASGGYVVYPFDLAVEADGHILIADPSARAIIRVHPVTGAQTIVSAETSFAPTGIAVEANGQIVVADARAPGGGALVRVDPVTGARTTLSPACPFMVPFS